MRFISLLLLSFQALFALEYAYTIPNAYLQERMNSEFPIVKEALFITLEISEPKLKLKPESQGFDFSATLKIPNIQDHKGRVAKAMVSMSAKIAYSKGGNIYLRKIKVLNIQSSFIANDMKPMLYSTIAQQLNSYYKNRPVYALGDDEGMANIAVEAVEKMVIVDEGIKVVFKIL